MKSISCVSTVVLCLWASSCSRNEYTSNLGEYEQVARKIAVCQCLNKTLPLSQDEIKNDGSTSLYLSTSNIPIECFERIDEYVSLYVDTVSYRSKVGNNLSTAKCLDLLNDSTLAAIISSGTCNYSKVTY